jgi:hypothetical protein
VVLACDVLVVCVCPVLVDSLIAADQHENALAGCFAAECAMSCVFVTVV